MDRGRAATRVFLFAVAAVPVVYSPFTLDLTLTARFIILAGSLLCALGFLFRSQSRYAIKMDFVLLSYAAYVLFCVLSLLWAQNISEALFEASKLVLCFFAFCFTFFCLKKDAVYFTERLQKISVILFYLALLAGCWQYLQIKDHSNGYLYAVTGLNSHKNLYASFVFLNVYFLIMGAISLKKGWRMAALAALVLSCVLLLILKTKAVWVGLAVTLCATGMIYLFSRTRFRLKHGLVAALFISLLAANVFFFFLLQPTIKKGIAYNDQQSTLSAGKPIFDQERLMIWEKTYHMIGQHTFAGVGMGNWQVFFPDATLSGLWRVEDLNYTFQRPHNDFLWILSETGLIGLNLFLLFLFALLWMTVKTLRNNRTSHATIGPALALAFLAGYCAVSFFDFPRERIEHGLWLSIICGSLYYYIRENNQLKILLVVPDLKGLRAAGMLLLGFILLTGLLRHQGEFHSRKMLARRSHADVVKEGLLARSFAYTLDPTSVPVCWYMGNAYISLGNDQLAHANFVEAYRLNPYNRNVLNDLASSYARRNDMGAAKQFYMEAARISPRFDDPKLNLAAIYINEQDYKKASECLKTLLHNSERRSEYQRIVDAFL